MYGDWVYTSKAGKTPAHVCMYTACVYVHSMLAQAAHLMLPPLSRPSQPHTPCSYCWHSSLLNTPGTTAQPCSARCSAAAATALKRLLSREVKRGEVGCCVLAVSAALLALCMQHTRAAGQSACLPGCNATALLLARIHAKSRRCVCCFLLQLLHQVCARTC